MKKVRDSDMINPMFTPGELRHLELATRTRYMKSEYNGFRGIGRYWRRLNAKIRHHLGERP